LESVRHPKSRRRVLRANARHISDTSGIYPQLTFHAANARDLSIVTRRARRASSWPALSRSSYFEGFAVAIIEGSYSVASLSRATLMGSEWRFRFRYPLAVGHGGSGRVCSGAVGEWSRTLGAGRGRIVARRLSLGARIRRQARRAAKRRSPCRALGLDRSARPKQRGPSCHQCGEVPRLPNPARAEVCRQSHGHSGECRGKGP
jgi:hypothetical protein